jgi:hypothetical protein
MQTIDRLKKRRELLFEEIMSIQKQNFDDEEEKQKVLNDTQIFLYCKLELSLVCLVLCTKDILEKENVPNFQRLHVVRFEGVIDFAQSIIDSEDAILSSKEYTSLGIFPNLHSEVDLVCNHCGREIVNLCFTNDSKFDGDAEKVEKITILCPTHRRRKKEDPKFIFFTLGNTFEMKDRFSSAKKAVEKWKEKNKAE